MDVLQNLIKKLSCLFGHNFCMITDENLLFFYFILRYKLLVNWLVFCSSIFNIILAGFLLGTTILFLPTHVTCHQQGHDNPWCDLQMKYFSYFFVIGVINSSLKSNSFDWFWPGGKSFSGKSLKNENCKIRNRVHTWWCTL